MDRYMIGAHKRRFCIALVYLPLVLMLGALIAGTNSVAAQRVRPGRCDGLETANCIV